MDEVLASARVPAAAAKEVILLLCEDEGGSAAGGGHAQMNVAISVSSAFNERLAGFGKNEDMSTVHCAGVRSRGDYNDKLAVVRGKNAL
jgi:hypothetical protein